MPCRAAFAAACLAATAHAHSRIVCPPARDMNGFDSTSIKSGPCGADTGDFSATPIEINPGPFTIHIQESIQHDGSGWAFFLSEDGDDSSRCLLLDHIPAYPDGKAYPYPGTLSDPGPDAANPLDEAIWDQLYITLDIPDVQCERCSIQMSNIMVDKAGDLAAPDGPGCTYDAEFGTCTEIPGGYGYHSCSVPLRINGNIPRSEYTCLGQPADWPTTWVGDDGMPVDASVPGLYRRESGTWENNFPRDVPDKYKTWAEESFRLQDEGTCMFVEGVRTPPPTDTTPPPPTDISPPDSDSDNDTMTDGEIIGISAGVAYGVVMLVVVGIAGVKKMKRDARSKERSQMQSPLIGKNNANAEV